MRVLIAEDDPRIAAPLAEALRESMGAVRWVTSGEDAVYEAMVEPYDALLLDVMLPDADGFDVARRLRELEVSIPIVFLTARGALEDRVRGLDLGGDAYLVKPFELTEVEAVLRAVHRRGAGGAHAVMTFAEARGAYDPSTGDVRLDGVRVQLTERERQLFDALAHAHGFWSTRDRLLDAVWGSEFAGTPRIVDVYVRHLRRKLGRDVILSRRGAGYRLA